MITNIPNRIMPEYPNERKDSVSCRDNQIFGREKSSDPVIQLSSLYESSSIHIESVEKIDGEYHLYGQSSDMYGICPYCGTRSSRVHSRYLRMVKDLSILGTGVTIHLLVRKFFCNGECCRHKTFAEQPGNEIFRYRRRTRRCEVLVAQQSASCSTSKASKLLRAMNIPMSSSTVLRDLHRIKVPDIPTVRKIGIDDWAFRKGVSYGSIIVNLESGAFLTLLGDREQDSFKEWLERHPDVTVVSRDRSTDYSAAIASTQRGIIEVADRFHLIKNLSEKISKLVNERYADYKRLVRPETESLPEDEKEGEDKPLLLPVSKRVDKRQVSFDAVKELRTKGLSIKKIAENVGISIPTVIKYIRFETLPPRSHSTRNPYHLYEQRVCTEYLEKGNSLHHIWEVLVSEGAEFGETPFWEHFKYLTVMKRKVAQSKRKNSTKRIIEETGTPLFSPIVMAVIIDKYIRDKELKSSENEFILTMRKLPWFIEICTAAREFYDIVRKSNVNRLGSWMNYYANSSISYLKSFIYGLRNDISAIENALRYPISNGILEGHVNKLKTIKRTMYGRAGINLLAIKMYLAEDVFFN